MTGSDDSGADELDTYRLARRAVLKATGGVAALSLGAGTAVAASGDETLSDMHTSGDIDPVFGKPSAQRLDDQVSYDHRVEMRFGVNPLVFAATAAETPSLDAQIDRVNDAASDGEVTRKEENQLRKTITIPDPEGGTRSVPLSVVASALTETLGFYFEPAGLVVKSGETVAFDAVSPDHLVASYHERHGRQNRVPGDPGSGTGLIASPLIPVGGYWLYQFEEPGVYDLNCTVHEIFGMVMRVVVTDDPNDVPELDVDEGSGRPPEDVNEISLVFDGFDPNLPSSAEALDTEALSPENIVAEGEVSWETVVEEHRGES